ncbi:MAG: hypothetical protein LQ338_003263 [Usnochroma carphineum]|nr:MAG: hypothetical protein LQ338_003263 [Usnochroma carphineum]
MEAPALRQVSNMLVTLLNCKLDKQLEDTPVKPNISLILAVARSRSDKSWLTRLYQQGPQGQYPPPQQSGQYPPQQNGQYAFQHNAQYAPQQPQGSGQYGQQYGAPPAQASRHQIEAYKQLLQTTIQQKSLQNMIPSNHPNLEKYAQRAASQIDQLCASWKVPREMGQDLVKLALFDIILYIDNSGSMTFEQDGARVEELRKILTSVVYVATLFDDDGISIRFMNDWPSNPATDGFDMRRLDRIQNEQMVEHIMSKARFVGLTPLGTELRNKVIDPLVLGPARARQLQKPVLVITITDGQPAGEPANAIIETIRYASNELSRMPQYGPGAISLQFAQVGDDQKAREFLAKLDSDPQVGQLVNRMVPPPRDRTEPPIHTANNLTRLRPVAMASLHSNLTAYRLLNRAMDHPVTGIKDMDNHLSLVMDSRHRRVGSDSLLRKDTVSISPRTTTHLHLRLQDIEKAISANESKEQLEQRRRVLL